MAALTLCAPFVAIVPAAVMAGTGTDAGPAHQPAHGEPVALIVAGTASGTIKQCSGVPLAATSIVVTAAHCIDDPVGDILWIDVLYAGRTWAASGYRLHPGFRHINTPVDLAVIYTTTSSPDRVQLGPIGAHSTVELGRYLGGPVTLVGYQHRDALDGPVTGQADVTARANPYWARRCTSDPRHAGLGDTLRSRCGLINGASGGPVLQPRPGGYTLVGVISTKFRGGDNGWCDTSRLTPALVGPVHALHPWH